MYKIQQPEKIIEKIKYNLIKRRLSGNQVSLKNFIQELKRVTCIKDKNTIETNIENLIDLGYIKKISVSIIQFCDNMEYPYIFEDVEDTYNKNAIDEEIEQNKEVKNE